MLAECTGIFRKYLNGCDLGSGPVCVLLFPVLKCSWSRSIPESQSLQLWWMWNSKLQWGERYLNMTTSHDRLESIFHPVPVEEGSGPLWSWMGKGKWMYRTDILSKTNYCSLSSSPTIWSPPEVSACWALYQTTGLHGDRKLYIFLKMWWMSENREMKSILKVVFHSSLSIYLWEQYWLGEEESSIWTDIDPNWWFTSCPEGKQIY